jgi:DNA-binding PadR family transcriptional regulator
MALSHTILAILANSPHSGYDISKRFEEVSCYWQASQQQIYRELGKMETQSWVTFEKVPQEGKPDKKIYRITDAGLEELRQWYREPTEPTPIREDLLVKVLATPFASEKQLVKELQRRRHMHCEKLMHYRGMEDEYKAHPDPPKVDQFRYLTLRRGIRYEQDWISWCDEVLAFLQGQQTGEDA